MFDTKPICKKDWNGGAITICPSFEGMEDDMQQNDFAHFSLAHYRFHLAPEGPLEMPPFNKGTAIRGGFGTAFRRLVCIDLHLDCAQCELRYTCPYTKV